MRVRKKKKMTGTSTMGKGVNGRKKRDDYSEYKIEGDSKTKKKKNEHQATKLRKKRR